MKKRITNKKEVPERSLLELLDQVEAEMNRLRTENGRLTAKPVALAVEEPKTKKTPRAQALGRGLSQLFGGPKRG